MSVSAALRERAKNLKRDIGALSIAARDSRVPWHAKAVVGFVAAYALSPIDLIPDFIPVLGYLDDLIVVPAGIWLAIRLIPPALMAEFRETAARRRQKGRSRAGLAIVLAVWAVVLALAIWLAWRHLRPGS